ncbi:MAG: calcium-binding protein [Gammaproteobacteria bacterium]
MSQYRNVLLVTALLVLSPGSALATFHYMKIEQAMGGVSGAVNMQAIQLRMLENGQNMVTGAMVRAWDAGGNNPVTIITFPNNVSGAATGDRVLIASPAFAAAQGPIPDFTMTNLIPASYLAAGRLTFEKAGKIYWSLCWGGGGYTGPTTGETFNDLDGEFGPCFGTALPSSTVRALLFNGPASALSTNNAADYSLTSGNAVFTNNSGASLPIGGNPVGGNPVTCRGALATYVGSAGADTYSGTPGDDVIAGLGGNDSLSGGRGNDRICGGDGKDILSGGRGNDRLYGDAGRDKLRGDAGNDKLYGGSGTDACAGGSGRDSASSCENTSGVP